MWWAFTSLRLSPWAREGYEQARARGLRYHRAFQALRDPGSAVTAPMWEKNGIVIRPRERSQAVQSGIIPSMPPHADACPEAGSGAKSGGGGI
jgi:hypothetical protein